MTKKSARMSQFKHDVDPERDFGGQCDTEVCEERVKLSLFDCFLVYGFSLAILLFAGAIVWGMFFHYKA